MDTQAGPNPFASIFGRGARSFDIYSLLLWKRIIFLGTPIDDHVANNVIGQLLFLQHENPSEEIRLFINSPGGLVASGLAIYDATRNITCDVSTICVGMAAGVSAIILAGGRPGHRFAYPNSRVMLTKGSVSLGSSGTDFETQLRESTEVTATVTAIISELSGQPFERIDRDTDHDFYLSADEALAYGLVDAVLHSTKAHFSPPE